MTRPILTQARQKVLGRKEMLAGAQEVLERCKTASEETEDEEDEEDEDEGQRWSVELTLKEENRTELDMKS